MPIPDMYATRIAGVVPRHVRRHGKNAHHVMEVHARAEQKQQQLFHVTE
jgi:hypothetical protein